jgi:hypothetical protein
VLSHVAFCSTTIKLPGACLSCGYICMHTVLCCFSAGSPCTWCFPAPVVFDWLQSYSSCWVEHVRKASGVTDSDLPKKTDLPTCCAELSWQLGPFGDGAKYEAFAMLQGFKCFCNSAEVLPHTAPLICTCRCSKQKFYLQPAARCSAAFYLTAAAPCVATTPAIANPAQ